MSALPIGHTRIIHAHEIGPRWYNRLEDWLVRKLNLPDRCQMCGVYWKPEEKPYSARPTRYCEGECLRRFHCDYFKIETQA